MGKVNILPPEITSQIAAGEVIERPASVVKELLENSLDAGAKIIEVDIVKAGKKSISIRDTGSGIDPDDLEKIFSRHATSKVHTLQDLAAINSLGFRGEALYSIGAIADIVIKSKTGNNDTGYQIHLRGGKKLDFRPVSMMKGTQIEVKELFFNTPARRKFLKADSTELYHILNNVTPYTLIYPECRFRLTHYGKNLMDLPSGQDMLTRINKLFKISAGNILTAEHRIHDKNVDIKMFLGDINIQRPRRDMQFVIVNNRPVYNRNISYHINQAYKSILPGDVFGFFVISINMPPEDLDVNIHPTKREVKIKNEYFLTTTLRSICEDTLCEKGQPKQMQNLHPFLKRQAGLSENRDYRPENIAKKKNDYEQFDFSPLSDAVPHGVQKPEEKRAFRPALKTELARAQFIGSFMKKYLFFGYKEQLLIIDQHAAAERITFERFLRQTKSGRIQAQHLLQPVVLHLTPQEMVVWEQINPELENIGFSVTLWDKENIAVHTHPVLIRSPEKAVRNMLAIDNPKKIDTELLAQKACRGSIKAGYEVNHEEARSLRNELLSCSFPFTCPHGRPTVIEISAGLFEKQFLRT